MNLTAPSSVLLSTADGPILGVLAGTTRALSGREVARLSGLSANGAWKALRRLVEHGLVSPSFVPPPEIRSLRNLTRYRVQLMGDRTRDAGRLEKLLEDASIKLSVVASNITGTSSREMLGALVAGERDAAVMADLAHSTLRRKIPDLT